jgi:1,4-alpha-glucan branching enzyme
MWGGVDWDHFNPETTRYFQDIVRFWLEEYHIDGFRFDWVGGVDYDSNEPLRPGFNPYHGIAAICWAARQAKPDCILIGEFWQLEGTHGDKTATRLVHETAMDAVWNGHFHHTLDDVLNHRWEWEKKDIFRAIGGYRDLGFSRRHAGDQLLVQPRRGAPRTRNQVLLRQAHSTPQRHDRCRTWRWRAPSWGWRRSSPHPACR